MNNLIQNGIVSELTGVSNVSYILEDKSSFAITEYKVLKSQEKHFIKCAKVLYNGKIKLLYFTANRKSFKNLIPSLDSDTFLTIVANIISTVVDINNNGFLSSLNLDLSFDKIYVDESNLSVNLIYIPVNNPNVDLSSFENEFRTEIIKLITSIPSFANDKMARVSGYLSNGILNMHQLYQQICSEIKGMTGNLVNNGSAGGSRGSSASSGTSSSGMGGTQGGMSSGQGSSSGASGYQGGSQPALRFYSVNTPEAIDFRINAKEFIIGKNPTAVNGAITFNKAISRVHCKIIYQQNSYFIVDLGSANGTYVNKMRISPQQPCRIKNGDNIKLANSEFMVQI